MGKVIFRMWIGFVFEVWKLEAVQEPLLPPLCVFVFAMWHGMQDLVPDQRSNLHPPCSESMES